MASIILATVADAEAIGAFQSRAWEQTYRGVVPDAFLDAVSPVSRAQRWAERIAGGERLVHLACTSTGEVVGVASSTRLAAAPEGLPTLELTTLYVDQREHGTGLGAELLRAAIGDEAAHLLVFSHNERAQRFYTKHGFARRGVTQRDPGTGLDEERWVRTGDRST